MQKKISFKQFFNNNLENRNFKVCNFRIAEKNTKGPSDLKLISKPSTNSPWPLTYHESLGPVEHKGTVGISPNQLLAN